MSSGGPNVVIRGSPFLQQCIRQLLGMLFFFFYFHNLTSISTLSLISCFHTRTGTLNFFRRYPEEPRMRMQMSKSVWTWTLNRHYLTSSLAHSPSNVQLRPRTADERLENSQRASGHSLSADLLRTSLVCGVTHTHPTCAVCHMLY